MAKKKATKKAKGKKASTAPAKKPAAAPSAPKPSKEGILAMKALSDIKKRLDAAMTKIGAAGAGRKKTKAKGNAPAAIPKRKGAARGRSVALEKSAAAEL